MIERSGGLGDGGRVVLKVGAPVGLRWVARHTEFEQDRQFVDEQVEGPSPAGGTSIASSRTALAPA